MYLEDFKTFSREDADILVRVIENIHPDFVPYKGVHFWKDAALTYLRNDVLGATYINRKWKNLAVMIGSSVAVLGLALLVTWRYK